MLPATVAGITEYGEIEFKVKSWTESITYDNLFGIGYIIDLILIVTMDFTDSDGKKIDMKYDNLR